MHAILSTLIQELHGFAKSSGAARAVIGFSGGLDSTVALILSIRAFGPKNVTALIMPEMGVSSYEETEHAKLIAEHFECTVNYEPINNFLVDYQFVAWQRDKAACELLKARLRTMLLKDYATCHNALVIGTANKSDFSLGLGSSDGEFFGTIHVLGDLYKTDVIELGRTMGLPPELTDSDFSRGLWPNQTDEDDLSGTWDKIDNILKQLEAKVDPESMIEKGMDAVLVHKITRLIEQNKASLKGYPIIHISRTSNSIKKAQKAEAESIS